MQFPVAASIITIVVVLLASHHFSVHSNSFLLPPSTMAFVPLLAATRRVGTTATDPSTATFLYRHSRRSFVGATTTPVTTTTTTGSTSFFGTSSSTGTSSSNRCRGNYYSTPLMASSLTTSTLRGGASSSLFSNNIAATDAGTTNVASTAETEAPPPPKETFRNDYKPLPYKVTNISMNFDIHDGYTIVTSDLTIVSNNSNNDANDKDEGEWVFDGEADALTLQSIEMNGKPLRLEEDYKIDGDALILLVHKDDNTSGARGEEKMVLTTRVKIIPETNTQLSGLYKSGSIYCTQCEAMGFRRITYYPDRPDNMAIFDKVRIEADKELYPVLLGNGNKIDEGTVGDEEGKTRHFATWSDPFPKPSYLFCIVVCFRCFIAVYFFIESLNSQNCSHTLNVGW